MGHRLKLVYLSIILSSIFVISEATQKQQPTLLIPVENLSSSEIRDRRHIWTTNEDPGYLPPCSLCKPDVECKPEIIEREVLVDKPVNVPILQGVYREIPKVVNVPEYQIRPEVIPVPIKLKVENVIPKFDWKNVPKDVTYYQPKIVKKRVKKEIECIRVVPVQRKRPRKIQVEKRVQVPNPIQLPPDVKTIEEQRPQGDIIKVDKPVEIAKDLKIVPEPIDKIITVPHTVYKFCNKVKEYFEKANCGYNYHLPKNTWNS